ncbi:hypothetical protein chiPu_0016441 [Chiloscyllium punctatum]|uniref:Uncharacterized protein n=1 Tax=Chiloscyllium punctatum TaxID=137246 RepID=A0A401T5J1_CHIPU|nr:hypothetical protein [Chiloscyllium punctatum]
MGRTKCLDPAEEEPGGWAKQAESVIATPSVSTSAACELTLARPLPACVAPGTGSTALLLVPFIRKLTRRCLYGVSSVLGLSLRLSSDCEFPINHCPFGSDDGPGQ